MNKLMITDVQLKDNDGFMDIPTIETIQAEALSYYGKEYTGRINQLGEAGLIRMYVISRLLHTDNLEYTIVGPTDYAESDQPSWLLWNEQLSMIQASPEDFHTRVYYKAVIDTDYVINTELLPAAKHMSLTSLVQQTLLHYIDITVMLYKQM